MYPSGESSTKNGNNSDSVGVKVSNNCTGDSVYVIYNVYAYFSDGSVCVDTVGFWFKCETEILNRTATLVSANPSDKPFVTIDVALNYVVSSPLRVSIADQNGNELELVSEEVVNMYNRSYVHSIQSLPAGNYLVIISIADEIFAIPFIKL